MLRYDRQTKPGLVALYDIRPGKGAGPFLQHRSPHGVLLRWEAWLIPRYIPLPTCYHIKFGSSVTKGVCINRNEPPKLRHARTCPLQWGRG